ncbi:MAG: 3'-5' exonuclease [Spongiibacteraceae bacterium]
MNKTLMPFVNLPESYVVLDTETTGLPDKEGPPSIVTLGLTLVKNHKILNSLEFKLKPHREINEEALQIHGISNTEAARFDDISIKWPEIKRYLDNNHIVIHNASFDWPIIEFHIQKYNLDPIRNVSIFCSQKSAIPFAEENKIPMSNRGPSLDALSEFLNISSLRKKGIHGAGVDTRQTALVVEALRRLGTDTSDVKRNN